MAMALGVVQGVSIGSVVEIVGLVEPVRCKCARLPDVTGSQAMYQHLDPEELEGKLGIYLRDHPDDPQKCMVKTFENIIAEISFDCLREYYAPDTLEGGFDLIWPADGAFSISFASAICSVLSNKGYCMVQMFANELDAKQMAESAAGMPRQYRMKREVETAYLGLESNTKVALRPHDTPAMKVTDAMTSSERGLTHIAVSLGNLPEDLVGFEVKSRTNTFVRMSYTNDMEQSELTPESLSTLANADDWDGDVRALINFTRSRTISMLHMVQNEGGKVFLYPRDAPGKESIGLPISPNRLLLFRHDFLDYSYQPLGKSLALQAWINKKSEDATVFKAVEMDFKKGVATLNPGRALPEGIPVHVLSLHAKMPQGVENEKMWWAEFTMGTDGVCQWPETRWSTDVYYMEGDSAAQFGKSYTKHGGFVADDQVRCFDNNFFGISDKEATFMMPGQRWCTEVGYCILNKAGFDKYSLENKPISTWVGDVGPDWHSGQNFWNINFPEMENFDRASYVHSHITANRLAYMYGFRGPTSSYDTACSASLVAMNAGHTFMMNDMNTDDNNMTLVMGWNSLLWPMSYIGNCAAGMLSHVGRSFTFNRAADGYQRGEGCGGVYLQRDCTDQQIRDRQGVIIGTATNQDGRSASITAPNGPSQTAVIKKSMAFAGIDVNSVGMAECHGTGTALGDPIEVGALQAVMRVRVEPILKVSTKAHIGHLEAGAGIAGLTKCLQMIRISTAPPNCHFNVINPNLVTEGYPVFFMSEAGDTGYTSGYCGVSSFGFGGTNSRCDVYNAADRGPRKTQRVDLPIPALPMQIFDDESLVSICGTWNDWEADMMELEDGVHKYRITLGETRVERFHFTVGDENFLIYPAIHMAGPDDQVLGPDLSSNGQSWVIDGREDGMSAGTVYEVTFEHGHGVKQVSWMPVAMSVEDGTTSDYTMYIAGTFNMSKLQPMERIQDGTCTYEYQFQIGPRNRDEFQFFINKDPEQLIYPGTNLSVCGPDASGSLEKFSVVGPQFSVATVKLSIHDGQITVTTHSAKQGDKTWGDLDLWSITENHSYFLLCSVDEFGVYHEMIAEPESPGIFKTTITLVHFDGIAATESFQLIMNKDTSKTLFPTATGAVQGPELDTEGRCWTVSGGLGSTYQITLDVNAPNRASMLEWHLV